MQCNRIATVSGLGVCDALQLELRPVQRARLARAIEALEPRSDYELHLVALLRAMLPPEEPAEPFVFVGPAGMVAEIVRASARGAVQTLCELPDDRARAADAAAWVRTFLDWLDVEAFSFDPEADPALPW